VIVRVEYLLVHQKGGQEWKLTTVANKKHIAKTWNIEICFQGNLINQNSYWVETEARKRKPQSKFISVIKFVPKLQASRPDLTAVSKEILPSGKLGFFEKIEVRCQLINNANWKNQYWLKPFGLFLKREHGRILWIINKVRQIINTELESSNRLKSKRSVNSNGEHMSLSKNQFSTLNSRKLNHLERERSATYPKNS